MRRYWLKWALLLGVASLALSACDAPLQVRFDAVYFFQNEEELSRKKVDLEKVSVFSRHLQSAISQALKKAKNQKIPATQAYVVVAVRSDGEVAAWLDAEPVMHEYFEYEITEAARKVAPFRVESGIVVFGMKMAINSASHTQKAVPEPKEWIEAKRKVADPNDVEQVVLSIWPE